MLSVSTSTSTRTCTASSTPRSGGCSAPSARLMIPGRSGHGRSSSAAPITARWNCPRRPAPEDVQRLRGDGQRPARVLQPDAVPHRRTTDALASLVDVLPTLLTLAGRDVPDDLGAVTSRRSWRTRRRHSSDRPAPRSGTRSTSRTTTTRRAPRPRTRRASPTGSGRSEPRTPSTRSTSIRPGAPAASTSCTTSMTTRSRSIIFSTCDPAGLSRIAPGCFSAS